MHVDLPVLTLRNAVLFPASVMPISVARTRSVNLIDKVFASERPNVAVVAQRGPDVETPTFDDIYTVGVIARILKVIRLASGNYSVVLQGVSRMRIAEPLAHEPFLIARVQRLADAPREEATDASDVEAMLVHLRSSGRRLSRWMPEVARDIQAVLDNVQEPGALTDLLASHLPISVPAKQLVLETLDTSKRLHHVVDLMHRQEEVYRVKQEIADFVKQDLTPLQREQVLRDQIKAIRKELGEADDNEESEIEKLREKLARAGLPPEAEKAAKKQLQRMKSMAQSGSEYQLTRTYVEWLAELPWSNLALDKLDVALARKILDEDHFGLETIKRRILEFIAVRKLRHTQKGPILCFAGPPGVGKTSLARSIAKSLGRPFVRISLGGVHDESEIRGHRRTYVGSMPGRIIAGMKRAGFRNPVVLLDEIDKLGSDYRGDPASALLEVLDPEQNHAFTDHYLEVPFDLSDVMFIATANRKDTIPGPLYDRMEMIDLPGYTMDEKRSIAKQFLIPKQLSDHGLVPGRLEFSDEGLDMIIEEYTREAGVRGLTREVAALCRAIAVRVAQGEDVRERVDRPFVEANLGASRFEPVRRDESLPLGVATGLSWSHNGGQIFTVESSTMPGNGQIHVTGQLGAVMKESVATALTFLRAHAYALKVPDDFLSKIDLHIHVPKGGYQIDTASAGLAVLISLLSVLQKLVVRSDTALMGEITLRGRILRVEGIKEKLLAAHRAGLTHVVMPEANQADLEEVPERIRAQMHIHFVTKIDEALALAFVDETQAPLAA